MSFSFSNNNNNQKHPNVHNRVERVHNKYEKKMSPLGILQGVDGKVSDADAFGFYEAADAFAAAKPWELLKSIRYRQFRLLLDPTEHDDDDDEAYVQKVSNHKVMKCFEMFDVVKLHGLTSTAGSKMNGMQGEVVPMLAAKPHTEDTRWRIRLFENGRVVSIKFSCLTLVRPHDPNRDFVAKVSGADGHGYKVDIYKSWASLNENLGQSECWDGKSPPCRGSADPSVGTFCICLEYLEEDLAEKHFPDEVALRKRLGLGPLPGRGDFPLIMGISADRERKITRIELRALEAGLRAAVQFIPKLAENPVPPPPYFLPLTFEDGQEDYVFHRGDGGGGVLKKNKKVGKRIAATTVRARCTFPSGNLLAPHYPWRSYPTLVERFAPRPLSVVTVEQAIEYHRSELKKAGITYDKIRADTRVGNFCYMAHKCGLANALWEAEEEHLVREALEIGRKILDIEYETDPQDSHALRRFVLDLSLEVGEWDQATAVLSKFPDIVDEELVWTAVLIYFKSRGGDSKTTRKALVDAVRFNPAVYTLLIGDRRIDEEEREKCRAQGARHFQANGRWFGMPQNAPIYCQRYSKYFYQDKGIIPWLESKREALKPLLTAEVGKAGDFSIDSLDDNFVAAVMGDMGIKPKNSQKTANKLSQDNVCCAHCGGIGNLSKCSRCHQVSYCNRECQLAHWKEHKVVCKKSAKAKVEQQDATTQQEEIGHPSWVKLNVATRRKLLVFHKEGGWDPWPVTAEAPAMLNDPYYSFLTAHPAMKFEAVAEEPPHGFRMAYENGSVSNVTGKIFQAGQAPFLMLREVAERPGPGRGNRVPVHNVGRVMEILLVDEIHYTTSCKMQFTQTYNHEYKGKMFDWPGEEAVSTCPGSGATVQPDNKTLRVLAAFNMHGYCLMGSSLHALTRIIPRIVTLEGLERLMGEPSTSSRLVSYSGPGERPGTEKMQPIYPDLLRRFAGQKPNKQPKRPPTSSQAWEAFHESGRYCAFEQYCKKGKCNMTFG